MSLIFCVFPSFISYIGNFIFVTYRGSIPLPLVSFRALANYFFSVRAAAFLAYSYYTCSAAFIRVAAKHVLNRPPQRTVQLDPLRCSSAGIRQRRHAAAIDDTRLQSCAARIDW